MNETIVKTEKLTELKNLVSEIEEIKKVEFKIDWNVDFFERNRDALVKIMIIEEKIHELIKTL